MSAADLVVRGSRNGSRLIVHVAPRGSRTQIEGVRDGALRVRVTAAPVEGAANDAIIRLLGEALDVAKRDLRIVLGARARRKTVEVQNLSEAAVRARLSAILP